MNEHRITLVHNLQGSNFQLGRGGTSLPGVDYERTSLPDRIPVGQSLYFLTKLFDDQGAAKYHDLTGATSLKLYGLPVGSVAAPTLLATGTLVGATPASGEAIFTVAKDIIPEAWASWAQVRMWFEIFDTDSKITLWQDVRIDSMTYDTSTDYPESSEIPTTFVDLAATAALDAEPGLQVVRIDTTAGDVTATLPSAGDANVDRFILIHAKGANDAYVDFDGVETCNGQAGPILLGGIGKAMDVIPNADGDGWVHNNMTVAVA